MSDRTLRRLRALVALILAAAAIAVSLAIWNGGASPEAADVAGVAPLLPLRDAPGAAPRDLADADAPAAAEASLAPDDVALRDPAHEAAPRERWLSGRTVREEDERGTNCSVQVLDETGQAFRFDSSNLGGRFLIRLPPEPKAAQLMVLPPRLDLEPVTVPLPAVDGDIQDVVVRVPRARGSVRGRVVDPGGAGVEGVVVRLLNNGARRTTAEGGHFRFGPLRDGSYGVAVDVPAYAADAPQPAEVGVHLAMQVEPVVLVVERGATIRGRVLDGKNRDGIAGVHVVLTRAGDAAQHRAFVTAAEGAFEFARMTAGDYRLVAAPPDGPYARATLDVEKLGDSETRVVNLELAPGAASLSGVIADDSGSAQPFGVVLAENLDAGGSVVGQSRARADSAGKFRFPSLAPGRWRVAPDREYCRSRNLTPDEPVVLELHAGAEATASFTVARAASIVGRIQRASDGTGGARAIELRLRDRAGRIVATTAADGDRFGFPGLDAGSYEIEAIDPTVASRPVLARVAVTLDRGESASARLQVP